MTARLQTLLITLVAIAAGSCAAPGKPGEERAVLVDPTATVRAEVHDTVRAALSRDEVPLAADALTTSSTLVIERVPHRTLEGRQGTGRLTESPERFLLLKQGADCILAHDSSGARYPLPSARCRVQ